MGICVRNGARRQLQQDGHAAPSSWSARCLRDHALASLLAASLQAPAAWTDLAAARPGLLQTLLMQAVDLAHACQPAALPAVKLLQSALAALPVATDGADAGVAHPVPDLARDLGLAAAAQRGGGVEGGAAAAVPDAAAQQALLATPLAAFADACLLNMPDAQVRGTSPLRYLFACCWNGKQRSGPGAFQLQASSLSWR